MSSRTPVSVDACGVEALDDFVELLEEAGEWLWDRGIRQWEPGSNRAQRPLLERFLQDGCLLVAREHGQLAAACLLTSRPTPEWEGRDGDAVFLHKLAVARFAAGRGLGHAVLEAAGEWSLARGKSRLRLDCWDGNDVLRRYYRDVGFKELEAVESHGYPVRLFEHTLDRGRGR